MNPSIFCEGFPPAEIRLFSGISAGIYNFNQTFTVSGESGLSIEYSLDGGSNWVDYSGEVTLSSEGTYDITARQTDSEGNTSPDASVISVAIDNTAPAPPSISGIGAGTYNTDQHFTVSGESGAALEYSLDGGTNWNSYSSEVTLSSEGTHDVTAKQTDTAGNTSSNASITTVDIDKTAPGEVTGLTSSAAYQEVTLLWTGPTDSDLDHIEITWTPIDGESQPKSISTGTVSAALTGRTDGTSYMFTVKTVDTAGNDSSGATISDTPELNVGDTGPAGGIVFYDDEADGVDDIAGARYLEAAPASTEWINKEWGDYGTTIGGDPGLTGIGDGQAATDAIVQHLDNNTSETGRAAQLCDSLTEGGYSDWFLPNKDELNAIWENIVDDGSGNNSGVGGFTDTPYWNSSEFSSDSAWLQDLSNGYQTDNYKDLNWYVRAVRAF